MSLLNQDGLRTATIRVNQSACLLEMTRADFDALLARRPEIAYQMLRVFSMRLKEEQNRTVQVLIEKNRQLTEAYEELKAAQEQIVEKKILDRELRQARSIQQSMLLETLPCDDDCDFGARMLPARMIGGDFYDLIPLDSDLLGVTIGDVSGKGIPAALYMALTIRLLRVAAQNGISSRDTIYEVNRHLLAMNAPGMFVTLLYGIYNKKNHEFIYTRAGHELPLLWDKSGNSIPLDEGRGQPLGFFTNPILDTQSIEIRPGDTLLLYTDGVTEAQDEQAECFGVEGLEVFVPPILRHPAQIFCDQLVARIQQQCGDGQQSDDITVLALKVLP
jgi:sigma-B regulation protein RsbU (phosphoserine phosphatase)